MKFPDFSNAPSELLAIDGHCGLLAAWAVLQFFGKRVEVSTIASSCRHTRRHGVFTVSLAACLKENGLSVSFHTDPDDSIGGFEAKGYARARALGLFPEPVLELSALLSQRRRGRIPIVLFNTDSNLGHFSPLLGSRRGLLKLPLADNELMPIEEFLVRWSAPEILRQCVIAGP